MAITTTSGYAPINYWGAVTAPSDSNNTSTNQGGNNTTSSGGLGSTAISTGYSPNLTSITTTDFGAIQAASNIAQTALDNGQANVASTLQGFSLLSGLTGQALLENSKGLSNQTQPLGVTLGKYAAIIAGLIVLAIVGVKIFSRGK